jgi:hypothetical protein
MKIRYTVQNLQLEYSLNHLHRCLHLTLHRIASAEADVLNAVAEMKNKKAKQHWLQRKGGAVTDGIAGAVVGGVKAVAGSVVTVGGAVAGSVVTVGGAVVGGVAAMGEAMADGVVNVGGALAGHGTVSVGSAVVGMVGQLGGAVVGVVGNTVGAVAGGVVAVGGSVVAVGESVVDTGESLLFVSNRDKELKPNEADGEIRNRMELILKQIVQTYALGARYLDNVAQNITSIELNVVSSLYGGKHGAMKLNATDILVKAPMSLQLTLSKDMTLFGLPLPVPCALSVNGYDNGIVAIEVSTVCTVYTYIVFIYEYIGY